MQDPSEGPFGAPLFTVFKRKYRNVPTVVDGIRYDSKLEAQCAVDLELLKRAGLVKWFIRQVNFLLEGGVIYRCDFLVVEPEGVRIIDATGMMTQAKKNKLKAMRARYGITVQLYQRSGKGTRTVPFESRKSADPGERVPAVDGGDDD